MKNLKNNKLKEEYENGVEKPSAFLWDKLEKKLDAAEDSNFITKKPPIYWWKYAATVLFLITLGIIFKINFQNKDAEIRTISQVKTLKKPIIQDNTSIAEMEKIDEQYAPENLILEKQLITIKRIKPQNYTSESQHIFQNKQSNIPLAEKSEAKETIEIPLAEKAEMVKIANPQNIASTEKIMVKYVMADELLFARELQKNRKNIVENQKNDGFENSKFVKLLTPSAIKILGFTVYSEDQSN